VKSPGRLANCYCGFLLLVPILHVGYNPGIVYAAKQKRAFCSNGHDGYNLPIVNEAKQKRAFCIQWYNSCHNYNDQL